MGRSTFGDLLKNKPRHAVAAFLAVLTIGILTAAVVLPAFAAPPGSPYAPGETLNPSCAPGDANCTVSAPVTGATTSTQILFGNGSSSAISSPNLTFTTSSGLLSVTATSTFTGPVNIFGLASSTELRSPSSTLPVLNGNVSIFGVASSTELRAPSSTLTTLAFTNATGATLTLSGAAALSSVTFTSATGTSATSTFGVNTANVSGLNFTNATGTNLNVSALTVTACSGCGSVTTSSAITAGYFPYWANATGGLNGTSTLFVDTATGYLGIGTAQPSSTLHVVGTSTITGSLTVTVTSTASRFISTFGDSLTTPHYTLSGGSGASQSGMGYYSGNLILFEAGNPTLVLTSSLKNYRIPSDYQFSWSSATTNLSSSDAGISRLAASTVGIGNGTAGTSAGTLIAGTIGIGTAQPSSTLHLSSSSPAISLASTLGAGSADPGKRFDLRSGAISAATGTFDIYDFASSTSRLVIDKTGQVGIGTDRPSSTLHVVGTFQTSATTTFATAGGMVGIGTAQPSSTLHVVGTSQFSSTSTFEGYTAIGNLAVGALSFDSDGGQVTWTDMLITASSSANTVHSMTAQLDGSPVLTVYGESDGVGGAQNLRVGIGTAYPSSTLHLVGNGQFTGLLGIYTAQPSSTLHISTSSPMLSLASTLGASSADPGKRFDLRSGAISAASGTFDIYDFASSTSRLVIDKTGQVGIGTDRPSSTLHVNGALTVSSCVGCGGGIGNVSVTAANTLAGYVPTFITAASSTLSATSSLYWDNANLRIGIGTAQPSSTLHVIGSLQVSSTALYVSSTTGYVGIGTSAPSVPFHIKNVDTDYGVRIEAPTGRNPQLEFNQGTTNRAIIKWVNGSSYGLQILHGNNADGMMLATNAAGANTNALYMAHGGSTNLYTNGYVALTIDASQRVGIGTAQPSSTLHVVGSFIAGSSTFNATTTVLGTLGIGRTANSGTGNTGNILDLYAASGQARAIAASGDIAGSSSWYAISDRASFGSYGGIFTGNSSNASDFFGISRADLTALIADGGNSTGLAVGTLTSVPLIFGVNNSERARFLSTGEFGIGTAQPSSTLHVVGTSTVSSGSFAAPLGAAGGPSYTFAGDTNTGMWSAGENLLTFSTGGSERLRIDSSGVLFSGTSTKTDAGATPIAEFYSSTDANFYITGQGARVDTNTPTPRLVMYKDITSGTVTAGDLAGLILVRSDDEANTISTSHQIQFLTSAVTAGAVVTDIVFNTVQTAAIGTTAEAMRIRGGLVGIGTAQPSSTLHLSTSSPALSLASTLGAGSADPGKRFDLRSGAIAAASGTFDIYDFASSTSRLVIDKVGNLGIGTATPSSILDIDTGSNTTGLRLRGLAETAEIADFWLDTIGNLVIDMTAGTDTDRFIDLRPADNNYGLILRESDGTGSGVYANFYVVDAGAASISADDYMTINVNRITSAIGLTIQQNGNIGISTVQPSSTLHISTSSPAISLASTLGAGSADPGKRFDIRSGGIAAASGTLDIFDFASSTSRLVVDRQGRVGINTPFPSSTLHINATCTNIATNGQCTDYAEYYPASEPVEPGEVLSADPAPSSTVALVKKATASSSEQIVGVVSSRPAVIVEGDSVQFMNGANYTSNPLRPAVALAGRVPVKVSGENGAIKIGDFLTVSVTRPGIAMKQTDPGMSIGIALEEFTPSSTQEGLIAFFVRTGFAMGTLDPNAAPADFAQIPTPAAGPLDQFAAAIQRALYKMGLAFEQGIARLKEVFADKVTTKELCVGATCVNEDQLRTLLINAGTPFTTEQTPGQTPPPESAPAPAPAEPAPVEPAPATLPEPAPAPEPVPPVEEPAPAPEPAPPASEPVPPDTSTPVEEPAPAPEPTPELAPASA